MGFWRNFWNPKKPEQPDDRFEPLAVYSDVERELTERYITDAFGPIACTFYDAYREELRIDIAVTEPDRERRFYTLTTVGMGAHRMNIPRESEERNLAFAELCVCLPPDWDIMRDTWPFHMLQETARHPFVSRDHLISGNAYHGPMMNGSGFAAAFVIPAPTRGRTSSRVMLPGGKIVNYYLALPIYQEEWEFILSHKSSHLFWERYSERVGSVVVDVNRESCVGAEEPEEEETWNI